MASIAQVQRVLQGDGSAAAVAAKAGELDRLAGVRCPMLPAQARICRPMVCVDIAGSLLGVKINRDAAIKLSAVSKKIYNETLQRLRAVLVDDTRKETTFRQLAVQFGCLTVVKACELLRDRMEDSEQGNNDMDGPAYTAAIFYTCCKTLKIRINKKQLLEACMVSETHFQTLCDKAAEIAESAPLERAATVPSTSDRRPTRQASPRSRPPTSTPHSSTPVRSSTAARSSTPARLAAPAQQSELIPAPQSTPRTRSALALPQGEPAAPVSDDEPTPTAQPRTRAALALLRNEPMQQQTPTTRKRTAAAAALQQEEVMPVIEMEDAGSPSRSPPTPPSTTTPTTTKRPGPRKSQTPQPKQAQAKTHRAAGANEDDFEEWRKMLLAEIDEQLAAEALAESGHDLDIDDSL